uniref:Zinc finger GRF-type domain-containing protein n=1 Tax=Oryza meridionalis TaxID=40149 RepID=A0A0E0D437_9ORYZ
MSRGSACSSSGGGNVGRLTPVPDRERPLEYEPTVFCKCKKKATRWISWSEVNSGRRYLACMNRQDEGCSFWDWYDGESTPFLKQLFNDLRDTVYSSREGIKELRSALIDAKVQMESSVARHKEKMEAMRKQKDVGNANLVAKINILKKERCVLEQVQ